MVMSPNANNPYTVYRSNRFDASGVAVMRWSERDDNRRNQTNGYDSLRQIRRNRQKARGLLTSKRPPSSGYTVDQGLYEPAELDSIPEVAPNLSRGCGNPTGFANLQPGNIVVDFGCGGGIDVILAAHKVGKQGRVVGIDFTPRNIERAKQAVTEAGLSNRNIELRIADMGESQLPARFADVVISNCVINLCPDKDAVYEEAYHILRPGGRLAISDIVLTEGIDPQLRERFQSTWAGCLGGAICEEDYWQTVTKSRLCRDSDCGAPYSHI